MKILILLVLLFTTIQSYATEKTFGAITITKVTSIYDADTFRVNIKEWPSIIGERIPIRINGIDAPEIRGKCKKEKELARTAKQETVKQLRQAKIIVLQNIRRGKYFRIIADVIVDGKNLAEILVKNKSDNVTVYIRPPKTKKLTPFTLDNPVRSDTSTAA